MDRAEPRPRGADGATASPALPAAVLDLLPAHVGAARWFSGRSDSIDAIRLRDQASVVAADGYEVVVALVDVEGGGAEPTTYGVVLSRLPPARAEAVAHAQPDAVVARLADDDGAVVADATVHPDFGPAVLAALEAGDEVATIEGGSLRFRSTPRLRDVLRSAGDRSAHVLDVEQSNTSIAFGDALILKWLRRVEPGPNPDLEVLRHLDADDRFAHTTPLLGWIELVDRCGTSTTLAVATAFVANRGDLWTTTTAAVADHLERPRAGAAPGPNDAPADAPTMGEVLDLVGAGAPLTLGVDLGPLADTVTRLGRRTAELHRALATGPDGAFGTEPSTVDAAEADSQALRADIEATLRLLARWRPELQGSAAADGERLLGEEAALHAWADRVTTDPVAVGRIRIHGDLHLGQVLAATDGDLVIIDFEGEPARPLAQRRAKRVALADVAGMVRSLHYAAAHGAEIARDRLGPASLGDRSLDDRSLAWRLEATLRYLDGYLDEAAGSSFLPAEASDVRRLLEVQLLEKALYEVRYELDHRPDQVSIPLRGVLELLDAGR